MFSILCIISVTESVASVSVFSVLCIEPARVWMLQFSLLCIMSVRMSMTSVSVFSVLCIEPVRF